eukprot:842360-Lingulodinium_polyedra.AAC.1
MASHSVHQRLQSQKLKREEEELVHVVEHNRAVANRARDKFTECKGEATIVQGKGRWQMLLPISFL